eukprot:CAMPEP_0179151346 /NCGR_PEP_ID=MMETSP0796-20121207/73471_1 /TAXON_ID=73915 /ORGANISM="Pyrodinium bahamense, Strain pbaha01" /LENGTH=50 /DNA_ID=CAMNT_0020852431 /DNA_START=551 /DNA_END=700 /DNA_ORIENTATION=+
MNKHWCLVELFLLQLLLVLVASAAAKKPLAPAHPPAGSSMAPSSEARGAN